MRPITLNFRLLKWFLGGALLLLCGPMQAPLRAHCQQDTLVLLSFTPTSGPTAGGSIVSVVGEGFVPSGAGRSKCSFADPGYGSAISETNQVYNSTHLTCVLPPIMYLSPSVLVGGHSVQLSITADTSLRSNESSFFIFDLTQMLVNGISPSEGLNDSQTLIFVHGVGFLDTGESTCSIDDNENTLVPAAFLNSTLLQCVLPSFPSSALVHVSVYLNGQISSSLQPETQSANAFTFFVTAPEMISCEFSLSYASLFLRFDREVEIGGENDYNSSLPATCDLVFSNETLCTLGVGASCSWYNSQQRSTVILLPPASLVQIGSEVALRGSNIRTREVEYSRLASGSIQVTTSLHVLVPIPVLEVPNYIPYCGDFIASGENSQHGGYRALEYKWIIGDTFTDSETLTQDPTLRGYIPDDFSNTSMLLIPSTAFLEERMYFVQLSVRNFLGLESTSLANITKLNSPAPGVTILGSRLRKVTVNAEIRLEGVVVRPECLIDTGPVDYSWTIGPLTGHGDFNLTSVNTNTAVLVIPPHTLLPNSTFLVVLTAVIGGGSSNSTIQLVTEHMDIRARINGGSRRALGRNDLVILDGALSEGLPQILTDVSIHWHCINITLAPMEDCLIAPHGLTNEIVFTLPAGTLTIGYYNITLTITYLSMTSTAYQMIQVLPYDAPHVLIMPRNLESVTIHRKLIVEASVSSIHPGVAKWSSEYLPDYGQLLLNMNNTKTPLSYEILSAIEAPRMEMEPLLYVSNVTSSPLTNLVSLVVAPGVFLHGNPYRFRLEVTDSLGHTGYSEVDIFTESLPLAGHLEIAPTWGQGLSTMFSLRAAQWTDNVDDTPLSYQFGFRCPCGNSTVDTSTYWLTGILARNRLSTWLPLACCGSLLDVVLRVYDQNVAMAEHIVQVNISQSADSTFDLLTALEGVKHKALVDGNWIEGLASLVSLSVTANRYPTTFSEVEDFKRQAVELLIALYNSSIPTSRAYLSQLLPLVLETTWQAKFTDRKLYQVSSMLESIISFYNSYSESATNVEPGISQTEAAVILDIYSNLISTHSYHEGNRIRTDSTVDSMLRLSTMLGYGMCLQLGLFEEPLILFAENFGTLKVSYANLPQDYTSTVYDNNSPFDLSDVTIVDFGTELFHRHLQRQCSSENSRVAASLINCSGVCIVFAQFKHNLRWQGSPYSSPTKTHFLQLVLLDPQTGSALNVSNLQSSPVELSFPIKASLSNYSQLQCVLWNDNSAAWHSDDCITTVQDSTRVLCQCSNFAGGQITVIERCQPGYYGETCAEVCPQGLWGEECMMSCDCTNRGRCSAHDGSCDCDPGWTGDQCQEICPEGSWGKECGAVCLCVNGVCSPVNGSCGCQPGWIGPHCDTVCPKGFYGDGCTSVCQCRDVSECNQITGICTCQPGYVGSTCHARCTEGYYGDQCALQCICSLNGTVSCDPVNGSCQCREKWEGELCESEITPLPSLASSPPSAPTSSNAGFQIWWAVVPIIVVALVALVIMISLLTWRARQSKRKKKVLPISDPVVSIERRKEEVEDVVATGCNSNDDDVDIPMTKGESYEVLIPKGTNLSSVFVPHVGDSPREFTEPQMLNGRQRWQIIRLITRDSDSEYRQEGQEIVWPASATKVRFKLGESKPELQSSELVGEGEEEEEEGRSKSVNFSRQQSTWTDAGSIEKVTEVVYERGVYLDSDATLKDLRNAFLESEQLDPNDRLFQFLQSDIPGDCVEVDTENEVLLSQLEERLDQPQTLYIETLEPGSTALQLELCVCGKYADLECTDCASKGYCSESCQQEDWQMHELTCRIISARRRKEHRKRRKHKKKKRKTSSRKGSRPSTTLTHSEDTCICGKTAEFECSNCTNQGYCSQECQSEDWSFHQYYCTEELEPSDDLPAYNSQMLDEGGDQEMISEGAKETHCLTSEEVDKNKVVDPSTRVNSGSQSGKTLPPPAEPWISRRGQSASTIDGRGSSSTPH